MEKFARSNGTKKNVSSKVNLTGIIVNFSFHPLPLQELSKYLFTSISCGTSHPLRNKENPVAVYIYER